MSTGVLVYERRLHTGALIYRCRYCGSVYHTRPDGRLIYRALGPAPCRMHVWPSGAPVPDAPGTPDADRLFGPFVDGLEQSR